jgi:hypothetical protein
LRPKTPARPHREVAFARITFGSFSSIDFSPFA